MLKKNLPFILIAVAALLMIAVVIWMFDKRIRNIEKKTYRSSLVENAKQKSQRINH